MYMAGRAPLNMALQGTALHQHIIACHRYSAVAHWIGSAAQGTCDQPTAHHTCARANGSQPTVVSCLRVSHVQAMIRHLQLHAQSPSYNLGSVGVHKVPLDFYSGTMDVDN